MLTRDLTKDIAQQSNRYRWQGHHRKPQMRGWRHFVAVPVAVGLFSALVMFPLSGHTALTAAPQHVAPVVSDVENNRQLIGDPLPKPMTCVACVGSRVTPSRPVGPTSARDAWKRPGTGGPTQKPPSSVSAVVVSVNPSDGPTTPPVTRVETPESVSPTVGDTPTPQTSETANPVSTALPEPDDSPEPSPSESESALPEEEDPVTTTPEPTQTPETRNPWEIHTCEREGMHRCGDDPYEHFPRASQWALSDDVSDD